MISKDLAHETGCSFLSTVPEQIFTPESFQGDERLMIETAEQFSRKEVIPLIGRLEKHEEGLMKGLIAKAGELGFCGVDVPEVWGGLGQSKALAARILEFLSLDASFSVTIGVTSGISQVGLVLFGTDAQRERYLPGLTQGSLLGAYALSEPNSGTDALSLQCRAERRGDGWALTGTKMWISNARWADLFLVIAKVDGEKITAFLVPRDTPGLTIGPEEHKMGLKASTTSRIELDGATVPDDAVLYEIGKGHHVALNALNLGRFKLAAMSLGPARAAIGLAAGYVLERRQFGRPIAEFGLIQKKFADMAAAFYAAESMLYRTAGAVDAGFALHGGSIEGNRTAAELFAVETSACKVFATEAEALIVDEALQCYGGYGYTEEFSIARIYRDARVSRIYEGTNEINRIFQADRVFRRADEGRASLKTAGDSFISTLLGRALEVRPQDQVRQGALADLLMLTFAEQSARLRAQQFGGIYPLLHRYWLARGNAQAAHAFQVVTGEAIELPAQDAADTEEIARAVYERRGPL